MFIFITPDDVSNSSMVYTMQKCNRAISSRIIREQIQSAFYAAAWFFNLAASRARARKTRETLRGCRGINARYIRICVCVCGGCYLFRNITPCITRIYFLAYIRIYLFKNVPRVHFGAKPIYGNSFAVWRAIYLCARDIISIRICLLYL